MFNKAVSSFEFISEHVASRNISSVYRGIKQVGQHWSTTSRNTTMVSHPNTDSTLGKFSEPTEPWLPVG